MQTGILPGAGLGPADVEIELKFGVPPAARAALLRALGRARLQVLPLRAAYVDTADDRLAAAGLVLRVRREGRRWVQTLKGRGDGLLQRLEHEVPLPPQRGVPVPDPARHAGSAAGAALAAALADGAVLQERYRTEIQRRRRVLRHGGARVEIAFDEGFIVAGDRRLPVCELEFELLAGAPTALIELGARWAARFGLRLDLTTKSERGLRLARGETAPVVRAAPSSVTRDMTPAAAFAAMVGDALAQVLPNAAACAEPGGAPEALHQLRIGLRRLRSVLRAVAGWSGDPAAARALAQALRAPFARLGAQRDDDAMRAWLAPALAQAGAPPLAWPPAAPADDVAAELNAPAFSALMLEALRLASLTAVPGPAVDTAARAWRRKAERRVAAAVHDLDPADAPALHRLRRRLKRLRYVAEALQPVLPRQRTARLLRALQRALEALGRCHDEAVALAIWRSHVDVEPAAWFVVGWLTARQPRSLRSAERRLRDLTRTLGRRH